MGSPETKEEFPDRPKMDESKTKTNLQKVKKNFFNSDHLLGVDEWVSPNHNTRLSCCEWVPLVHSLPFFFITGQPDNRVGMMACPGEAF